MSVEHLPMPVIATCGGGNKVIVHRDGKPPQVLQGHTDPVPGLCFCPTNPDLLASVSDDKTVIVWGVKNNSKIATLGCPYCVNGVSWSCDGQYIAAACDATRSYIFDAHDDYKQLCVLHGHSSYVVSVAFNPQHPAVCATASQDKTARVWRLVGQHPECFKVLEHGQAVRTCCWMPDGQHLVSGCEDKKMRLWNIEDGIEVAKFGGPSNVVSVAASPDGRMIVAASADKTCRIWEAKRGGKLLQVLQHPDAVRAVAFSGNGHVVTGCRDGNTRVWSIAVGKVVVELGGHTDRVWSVAVPPMGAGDAAAASSSQPMSKAATVSSSKPNNNGFNDD